MRRPLLTASLVLLIALLLVPQANAQLNEEGQDDLDLLDDDDRRKLAQTSMQFLTVPLHPRDAALAEATTALEWGAGAVLSNPAAMDFMPGRLDIALGQNEFIADISYNWGSLAYKIGDGRYGTVGLHVLSIDYGTIQGTRRSNNDKGYEDTDVIEPTALAAGIGYAKALSDRFSVGGNVKYVKQDLGAAAIGLGDDGNISDTQDLSKDVAAFDFGMMYRTGFRSLIFAASIRNFASELKYAEANFELPLTFKIGISMDVTDFTSLNQNMHSFRVAVDATHPRAFAEQVKIGGEYTIFNTLSLRAGYLFPSDEQGINLGAGLQQSLGDIGIGADYSYSDYGIFGDIHRVALRLFWN